MSAETTVVIPMTNLLQRTMSLRDEAWQSVMASPAFADFAALDDAVSRMGGQRVMRADAAISTDANTFSGISPANGAAAVITGAATTRMHFFGGDRPVSGAINKRVSHGDAAELVLREVGEPMTGADIMALAPEKGAKIGGEKPLPNFTSTLSRDPRFHTFRMDGQYLWGLSEWGRPPRNEAEPYGIFEAMGSASSSQSSQEGGDGHDPATT